MVPGIGPVLAGGALATALGAAAGTTLAGAVAGGAVGYLRDMGMPEQAASVYADRIAEGDYLITATIDSEHYDEIKRLLLKYNAAGVDVNVVTAGQAITDVRGADPAIAQELRQPPIQAMSAAEAIATGALHTPTADPARATLPNGDIIATEALDGTPLIPAQVVASPSQIPVTAPPGRTPDEEAAHQERLRQVEAARVGRGE